jgi:hypothetical protein
MKKLLKISIIYTPIILIIGQVICNLLYIALPNFYSKWYYVIATLFGTNLICSVLMVGLTYHFKFCKVSRAAAISQVIFCLFYLAVSKDDIYNITFQVVVGIAALILTIITMTIESDSKWTTVQ